MSNFGAVQTVLDSNISANSTTDTVIIQGCVSYSVQVVTTNESSFSATLTLEASLDGVTWGTVPTSSTGVVGNTSVEYDVVRTGMPLIRVRFASVSGSADVKVYVYAKGN